MMEYFIDYTEKAIKGLLRLRDSEPKAYAKAQKLIEELRLHPKTGTGKPEQLKGDRAGQWSRRISNRHRMVYIINDTDVVVLILTTIGHYDDK